MKFRELQHEDALHIANNLRDVDQHECNCQCYDASSEALAERCMNPINAKWVVCSDDGEPVAMLGVSLLHPGVGEAWLLATDRWNEVWRTCTKLAIQIRDGLKLHRIQVHTAAFHTNSHAWLEVLGFQREAILRKYGSGGEDFYLMSILKDKEVMPCV